MATVVARGLRAAMLLAAAAALAPSAAAATTYNVDSTVDAPAANPAAGCASTASGAPCTLRGAVQAANAAGGANTIQLPAGDFELTIAPTGTTDASTGNLDVSAGTLTVTGAGQTVTTIDGNDLDRIFNVAGGANLALSDVTLQGGRPVPLSGLGLAPGACPATALSAVGAGGAILATGGLTLTDDTLTQNSANGSGGAVELAAPSVATITGTTVTSNTSCEPTNFPEEFNSGGGIDNGGGAALTINSSTINDNQALGQFGEGGGVAEGVNNQDSIAITSSTLDGNHADSNGGGVGVEGGGEIDLYRDTLAGNSAGVEGGGFGDDGDDTDNIADTTITGNTAGTTGGNPNVGGGGFFTGGGNATIAFSTITDNTSVTDAGGNLDNGEGSINLADSIVAGGVGSGGTQENCSGFVNSQGNNLFDTAGTDCGAVAADILSVANPVGPLADNGGPTFTQALPQGSPAIDAANDTTCAAPFTPPGSVGAGAIDERGVVRPQGPHCDIGAYEAGDADLAVTASASASSVQVGQQVTFTDVVTNNGPVIATGVTFTDPAPAGFTISSTSTSQGSCTHTSTTVSCTIGVLGVGSSATIRILVTTTSAGAIDEISRVSGNETDPNLANNTASVSVSVTPAPTQTPIPIPTPTPTPTPTKPVSGLKGLSLKGVPRGCTRSSLSLRISVSNRRPPQTTVVELDGRRIASSSRASFRVSIALSRFAVGRHTLTIKATDRTHRSLTIHAHFSRCTPAPRFTG